MTVVKINAITVPAERTEAFERRFAERASLVEGMPGFAGFELLRPVSGDERYFVVTHWVDDASFQAWVGSESFRLGHAKTTSPDHQPVAAHAELLEFDVVDFEAVIGAAPA
jgi:heme-degrading monooxygenase HmoA